MRIVLILLLSSTLTLCAQETGKDWSSFGELVLSEAEGLSMTNGMHQIGN